ncbi:type IV toxin-antitoxin system AbiEi family antitoxin domain-containing protein [Kribbella kalugense]|uniref:Very-short-patch-repair endonuclease n=1 Tax=Kribbella kalugense TaxID=2512221 RepID=A0A4R7ZXL8_9ACTN|nr:type IV toxin-antitoxin system AbiEi family antitoxin domain-containing protein [Kribbella kalugense]TDW22752.1 very-short-patch-repair endonuclease [Kribbella kalugense]
MTDVVEILQRSGGSATFAQLRGFASGRTIRRALAEGRIKRVAKGVYALPVDASPLTVARAHGGVLSHESAAQQLGLDVVTIPLKPHVTIGRTKRRRTTRLPCTLHWSDAPELDGATTPVRTVLDCAQNLPFGEALAVADSALRNGLVSAEELLAAAIAGRRPGRARAIKLIEASDARAASALESMLRARVLAAGFGGFVPQYVIADGEFFARVDLADPKLRLVLEADSFAYHASRDALRRDCRRYVNLAMRGWTLLRFSWEDVVLDPDWVAVAVTSVVRGGPARRQNPLKRAA